MRTNIKLSVCESFFLLVIYLIEFQMRFALWICVFPGMEMYEEVMCAFHCDWLMIVLCLKRIFVGIFMAYAIIFQDFHVEVS